MRRCWKCAVCWHLLVNFLFCEHGRAPGASVQRWQEKLQPLWGPMAGGCHLDRDIPELLMSAGFTLIQPQTRYLPGPRSFTFHNWGETLPNALETVHAA